MDDNKKITFTVASNMPDLIEGTIFHNYYGMKLVKDSHGQIYEYSKLMNIEYIK